MARKKHFVLDIDNIQSAIDEYFKVNTKYPKLMTKDCC